MTVQELKSAFKTAYVKEDDAVYCFVEYIVEYNL